MQTEPIGPRRLRVLFVADFTFWIAARIARNIWSNHAWIEPGLLSAGALAEILDRRGGEFPLPVDLVHFLTPDIATKFRAPFERICPCVATVHHIEDDASTAPIAWVDAVMTVCRQWHDSMADRFGDPGRFVMLHNSVDTALFRPPAPGERARLRRRLGIAEDAFCVGFSGKKTSDTHGRKGLDVFLGAAERLSAIEPRATFVMMGPGWEETAEAFRARGVKMVLRPFQLLDRGVAEFYRLLDAYCVTSRIEGGPVPLIEAMASEVPGVSTRVGIAPEAIAHGENGLHVPAADPEAVAAALAELARDPARRRAMGAAARRTMVEAWTPEITTRPAADLYRIAQARFRARAGAIQPAREPRARWREGEMPDLDPALRKSIAIGESFRHLGVVARDGTLPDTARVALRTLAIDPLSQRLWRRTLAEIARGRSPA